MILLLLILFILLLLLFLLFLLFLQLVDFVLDQVAIMLCLVVSWLDLQSRVVRTHGLSPCFDRLFGIAFLGLLSESKLSVPQIIIGPLLQGHFLGVKAVLKSGGRFGQITGFVSRRSSIELELGFGRFLGSGSGILLL